jgi:LEA14-like dessication related protein
MAALKSAMSIMTVLTFSGCQTVTDVLSGLDKPTARVEDVNITAIDLEGAELSFVLEIANPYGVALPLTDLRYALSSRGRSIVSGDAPLDGSIPAGGERTITIPAAVRFADILNALSDVRPGAVVPYDAELDLIVDVPSIAGAQAGAFAIPLRHRDELPVPARPDVSVESIEWSELSFDRARAVVHLAVGNRNEFPLDLRGLSYTLALSGVQLGSASLDEALALGAGDDGVLQVPISVSPLALGQAALGILQGDRADYALMGRVEADTPYGAVELPFERRGEVRMRRR